MTARSLSQNTLLTLLVLLIFTSGDSEQSDALSPPLSLHLLSMPSICSRIDYCNSLLVGLPKVRLSPLQSVMRAAARLIARIPPWSHISSFMFHHLHWLPLTARIQLKILTLIYRSYSGYAPKYLRDLIRLPISATSLRPLRSLDRHDLLFPRARTAMAKTRAFAFIGPALWNQLSPSTCLVLLTGGPSTSFRCLKTAFFKFFSVGLSHWERL